MEAAYGLAITLCMIATSIFLPIFLCYREGPGRYSFIFISVYFTIEFSFLFANLDKFPHGGYVTLIVGGGLFLHYVYMVQSTERSKTVMWNLCAWNIIFPRSRN